jgi:hypothetical protein
MLRRLRRRALPFDPLVEVAAPEAPLPTYPDRRQLSGPDQPVNRPRIDVKQFSTSSVVMKADGFCPLMTLVIVC